MMDIEEKLPGILAAEADRYDVPVFSAERIAGNAVRKGFWRQRTVVLIAAVGLAGTLGGGGAVIGAAGHDAGHRVTVTFHLNSNFPSPPKSPATDGVRAWLRDRARAEGLKEVDVTVHQDPFSVEVTGRAADVERLRMLGLPGHLSLDRLWSSGYARGSAACSEPQQFGPPVVLCDPAGFGYNFDGGRDTSDLKVVEAHAERRSAGPDGWTILARLDAAGRQTYYAFTADVIASHDGIWAAVDATVYGRPAPTAAVRDGVVDFGGGFTEQQARDLATALMTPGDSALMAAEVTVSTR